LLDILAWHERGTRYGIKVDSDGLLSAGDPNTQLTWMDARVNGVPVTPRFGKPVEIQALWYNALEITTALGAPKTQAAELKRKAARVRESFERLFWNEELECLNDCISNSQTIDQIRPNQIFALSLPFALLSPTKARKVLSVIERKLYTPMGLRSLAPSAPQYIPRYEGDPHSRDHAYHQGTVWSFLLGPYISAQLRFGGEVGLMKAKEALANMAPHLAKAGIGTISEVFDGDFPHTPGGCFAQAWGVAELLRSALEIP
jgi:predicted glycogen debranching enzyme